MICPYMCIWDRIKRLDGPGDRRFIELSIKGRKVRALPSRALGNSQEAGYFLANLRKVTQKLYRFLMLEVRVKT